VTCLTSSGDGDGRFLKSSNSSQRPHFNATADGGLPPQVLSVRHPLE
jgi:hypothetical protein